jgi:DNA-binding transcriptional LysR family regulator
MDLPDLRLVLAIADSGSITSGAEARHLSLPAASARLRLLERRIGTTIFDRHRRGVTPTPAGSLLVSHARDIVRAADRLDDDLATYTDTTVRLLVNTSASTSLTDTLTTFLAAHPDTRIDIDERPSGRIVAALAEHRADLGVLADSVPHGALRITALRPDPLVAITGTAAPHIAPGPTSLSALLDQPFVGLSRGKPLQDHIDGHAHPFGKRLQYRLRLPAMTAVLDAVEAGVGVAILPAPSLIHNARITIHPLTDSWAARNMVLGTAPDARPSAAATALQHHLTTTVPGTI